MNDARLRELLRNEPNPVEKLASEQQLRTHSGWFAKLPEQTAHFVRTGERIVVLECGHYVLSRALYRAGCPRCGEMIRRGYDHDGFRRLGMPDEFNWPEDPLLELNEGGRRDGFSTITRRSVEP